MSGEENVRDTTASQATDGQTPPGAARMRPEDALKALDESEYSEEEFAKMMGLYEDTMQNIAEGEIVEGTVLAIDENGVVDGDLAG